MDENAGQFVVLSKFFTTYFNIEQYAQNEPASHTSQQLQSTYLEPSKAFTYYFTANKVTNRVFTNFFYGFSKTYEYITYSFLAQG